MRRTEKIDKWLRFGLRSQSFHCGCASKSSQRSLIAELALCAHEAASDQAEGRRHSVARTRWLYHLNIAGTMSATKSVAVNRPLVA